MPEKKAPYIEYNETVSYLLPDEGTTGAEIPLFIVKTNDAVEVSDINPNSVSVYKYYSDFKEAFSIPDEGREYNLLDTSLKKLDTILKNYYEENSMYTNDNGYGLAIPYIYVINVGNNPTVAHYKRALMVSEVKKDSTVVVIPDTEDINFMKAVATKLSEESKDGVLRISYFKISGQGKSAKLRKGFVVRPTFNHHGYKNVVQGYKLEHQTGENTTEIVFCNTEEYSVSEVITKDPTLIYQDLTENKYYKIDSDAFVETTLEALDGYSEVIEAYKHTDNKFYEESTHITEVTPVVTALYFDKTGNKTYTYTGTGYVEVTYIPTETEEILYEGDADYNFFKPTGMVELGGTNESFDEYRKRIEFISQQVNSSRVCLVDENSFGKTIARICSTPYYIEPGYLPYMSVSIGVFGQKMKTERDLLVASGLIFNEDDYTLSRPTPRICLGTSTAWGSNEFDSLTADALIHARRNVDYQVRELLKIIAPQLKRNETSVTLRHVQNQIDVYLNSELEAGNIMEYSFELEESSYNPYTLLLKGSIVPINSTLGIDFENTIKSPYTIASDYV